MNHTIIVIIIRRRRRSRHEKFFKELYLRSLTENDCGVFEAYGEKHLGFYLQFALQRRQEWKINFYANLFVTGEMTRRFRFLHSCLAHLAVLGRFNRQFNLSLSPEWMACG
jgi:hypothetical protein